MEIELTNIVKTLLNMRGIVSEEDIQEFLSDKPQLTHSPELMPDIMAGARLILTEISNGGKIMIYGDYDADGITSTTLMLSVLSHLMPEERLGYYIPSRFDEGYGMNNDAVRQIKSEGYTMIVTVDCGSSSIDEVKFAKELGLRIVVTDHHNITGNMPDCFLINPKRPDSIYPFRELSGCGVAFKLAQVLQSTAGLPKSVLTEVLDLVAIGTIGDIMPLVDENRTLVKFGLKAINMNMRPGLKQLVEGAKMKTENITSDNVGFIIVPHLNASGRIEDASRAVKLMKAKEKSPELDSIVATLLEQNQERKRIQTETYARARELVNANDDFIVVRVDNAHEGIIGIVAGKLKDEFYRPTILVTPTGDGKMLFKGTGRSIEGVDLHGMLNNHAELFAKFGGHKGACGFTMPIENLEALRQALNTEVKKLRESEPHILERKIDVDMDIDFSDISVALAKQLKLLEPFGTKNKKPVFRLVGACITDIKFMGQDEQHARFIARPEFEEAEEKPIWVPCVLFNKAQQLKNMTPNDYYCDIIGSIEYQIWQGQERLQFMVSSIERA